MVEAIVPSKRVSKEIIEAADLSKGMIGATSPPTIDPHAGIIGTTSPLVVDPLARLIGTTNPLMEVAGTIGTTSSAHRASGHSYMSSSLS